MTAFCVVLWTKILTKPLFVQRFFSAICQNGQKRKKNWHEMMMMNYERGYYAINQNGKLFGATTSMQQLGVWGDAFKNEKLLQLQNTHSWVQQTCWHTEKVNLNGEKIRHIYVTWNSRTLTIRYIISLISIHFLLEYYYLL